MLSFIKKIFNSGGDEFTLDTVIRRSSEFLNPQLRAMEKLEGNKFGFITFESIAYILNVALRVGGRPLKDDEFEPFLVGVLGEEYRPMVQHRLEVLRSPRTDHERFKDMMQMTAKILRDDLRKETHHNSRFLINIASDVSEAHTKIQQKIDNG